MKLIKQVLRLLKQGVTIEHRLIKDYGLCYHFERIVIRATLSEKNKVRTLIHECLHWLYPELSERSVRALEDDLFNKLTRHEYDLLVLYLEDSE